MYWNVLECIGMYWNVLDVGVFPTSSEKPIVSKATDLCPQGDGPFSATAAGSGTAEATVC